MNVCVLITGSTGSGKSTLVDSLGAHFHTVHSGDTVRQAAQRNNGDCAVAPDYLNGRVKAELFSAVAKHRFVAAECFPRNDEQVGWIEEIRAMGVAVTVIRTVCPADVRHARVTIRDHADEKRMRLDLRKLAEEGDDWDEHGYFAQMLTGVPHTVLDTSEHDGFLGMRSDTDASGVDAMLHMATCVRRKHSTEPLTRTRCVDRAIEELLELRGLLANAEDDGTSAFSEHVLEEVVDALFFLCVLVGPDGLRKTGADLLEMFSRKFAVNVHRADTGNKPHVYNLMESSDAH